MSKYLLVAPKVSGLPDTQPMSTEVRPMWHTRGIGNASGMPNSVLVCSHSEDTSSSSSSSSYVASAFEHHHIIDHIIVRIEGTVHPLTVRPLTSREGILHALLPILFSALILNW
jgi:hypothetical protein